MEIVRWDTTNFGDCLNDLIWPHFLPHYEKIKQGALLYGVGSLINHRIPDGVDKYFLGSGFGHGDYPKVDGHYKFVWVRGPRTSKLIHKISGIVPEYISDGALLLNRMYREPVDKIYEYSFVPHCSVDVGQLKSRLIESCYKLGINYIDVDSDRDYVINEIRASKYIMTEALHGAIVSDAFSVPWIPLSRVGVFDFKWFDYCESVGRVYTPFQLPYKPSLFDYTGAKGYIKKLGANFIIGNIVGRLKFLLSSKDYKFADPVVVDNLNERMIAKIHNTFVEC